MLANQRYQPPSEAIQSEAEIAHPMNPIVPAWQPDGPTLRFKELLKVTRVGKSKAYELMKTDPSFPQGIPLYDSDRSPMFFWTHEAIAWVNSRATKFRSKGGR